MKGGNLYALAKILGHSNPKMTLDRYTRLSPEFVNVQRRVMDRTFANGHQMDTAPWKNKKTGVSVLADSGLTN
jgi:hypothetical protein